MDIVIFLLCFLLYIFYISIIFLLYSVIFLLYFCYISTIYLLYFYYISAILLLYFCYTSTIFYFCNISAIFQNWKSDLRKAIKVRLFTALIESVLLYGSETWTMTKRLNKVLDGC